MPSLEDIVHQSHADQPHPQAPSVKVGEYPVAAKLASVLKFGQGHATPQEVGNFWREFQSMNESLVAQNKMPVSPDEFSHLAQQIARSSFTYHGRPPTMHEIARLRDADPKTVMEYFGSLPDEHYPSVPAAKMVEALHAARPWANMITGGEPTKLDGAYLFHSGHSAADYYTKRAPHDGSQDRSRMDARVLGSAPLGGQQVDQRTADTGMATGSAAASRSDGVSAR